jgi:hypothetical protein
LTCEQYIESQLRKTSNGVKLVDLAVSLMLLIAATLGFFGLMALLDHWIVPGGLSTWARAVFFVFFFGGAIAYVALRVVPILLGRINPVYAAYTIEHSAPALKNSLLNFLLFRGRQRGEVPEPVYQALEQQAAAKLSAVPVELAVDRSKILHIGYLLMALAVVCALYKVLSPKDPLVTVERVLLPWADILPPSRVKIEAIEPGTTSAVRGETVQVSARVRGLGDREEVRLIYTTDDGQAVDRALPMTAADGGEVFSCGLPDSEAGLQEALYYRIEAGDAVSHRHRIEVITAPTIALKTVFLQYPEYTKLVDRRYVRDGNLRAIEGTRVSLRVETNAEIKTAWVDFENDKRRDLEMKHKGTEAWVTFALELDAERRAAKHASYSLRFTDAEGRSNDNPVEYRIEVTPDRAPEIAFLQPEPSERDIEVPLDGALLVETSSIDPDFALAKVELHGRVGEKEVLLRPLLEKSHAGQFVSKYELTPSKEGLKPGDVVDYWAVAIDNKHPQANRTETEIYRFTVTAPERPEDQLAKNDPRNKPEQDPNTKPDDSADGQPMPNEQNPADDKQQPDKQNPEKKPEKNPDQKDPEQVEQQEQEQQKQDEQQDNPQQGKESKPGGQQQPGEGDGQAANKQKSKEKSKAKPKPGEQGENGGDRNGGSQGEPSDESPENDDSKQSDAQGGKPTGKKSDSKPPSGENNPDNSEMQEGDSDGEPGAAGNKSGPNSGKPSDGSELADQQNQQPEEVAKDDEGTVFDRLKKALEKKQQEQQDSGQDSPGNTAQQQPGEKNEDQLAQGDKQQEPGKKQGEPQAGDQPMSPNENPSQSNDAGQQKTNQQPSEKPDGQKSEDQKPGGENAGEKNTGEENPDDSKSNENGAGEEDPLFGDQEGKKPEPKNSDGSAKKQSPDKKPMPGEGPLDGTGEKVEPMPGDEPGQKPGEKPGEDPKGEQQPGGQAETKSGTENKPESGKKTAGKKPGESPEKPQPAAGEQPSGSGGAGNKPEKDQPSPAGQDKQSPKEKSQKPGETSEKQGDDAQSPAHGEKQSDSEGEMGGDKPGGGGKGGGQDSDQPGLGSAGGNTPDDAGSGKANEPGDMGETSEHGGDKDVAKQPPKTEGEKKAGEGREKRPDEQTPGEKKQDPGNKPGQEKSQSSSGQQQGEPGQGKKGNAPPTDANGQPLGGDGTREGSAAPPKQEQAPGAADPNLEYSRKATDLVLDYLENQLQQDELSPEVQKQLPGWTKEDIQQLVDRARTREAAAQGQGAESAAAKQEFEDWLRSLGLKKNTARGVSQQGGAKADSQSGLRQTRGAKAPAEYADQVEAYKKGLSRERP